MTNMFDYLTWRGDLTFSQVRPNPVDALIFSTLAYVSMGTRRRRNRARRRLWGSARRSSLR